MNIKKTKQTMGVLRSVSSIRAVCDFLCNTKNRMVTVDFTKKDGSLRTINGMMIPTAAHLVSQGKFRIKENRIRRNKLGQCRTIATQYRMINLSTVSRLAFNKVVYNFM